MAFYDDVYRPWIWTAAFSHKTALERYSDYTFLNDSDPSILKVMCDIGGIHKWNYNV